MTILFRIIPILGLIRLYNTGDTRPVPYIMYSVLLLNNTFWTIYGLQKRIWQLWFANSTGVFVYPIFLSIFIYYYPALKSHLKLQIILIISIFAFINMLFYFGYFYFKESLNGSLASFFNVSVQFSQILIISVVLKTWNSIYIDISLMVSFSFMSFLNAWFAYLVNDPFYLYSNSFALFLNIIQIVLYIFIGKDDSVKIVAEETTHTENEDLNNEIKNSSKIKEDEYSLFKKEEAIESSEKNIEIKS